MSKGVLVPRDKTTSIMFAQDEYDFIQGLADELGLSKAQVMRNAIVETLMQTDSPADKA